MRSMVPFAWTAAVSGTTSWYFSEDDPAFSTRTGESLIR